MKTVKELKKEAKDLSIKNFSKMKRDELNVAINVARTQDTVSLEAPPLKTQPTPKQRKTMRRKSIWAFSASMAVILIVTGFTLAYLTRSEPTWYEKLMAYLPF